MGAELTQKKVSTDAYHIDADLHLKPKRPRYKKQPEPIDHFDAVLFKRWCDGICIRDIIKTSGCSPHRLYKAIRHFLELGKDDPLPNRKPMQRIKD